MPVCSSCGNHISIYGAQCRTCAANGQIGVGASNVGQDPEESGGGILGHPGNQQQRTLPQLDSFDQKTEIATAIRVANIFKGLSTLTIVLGFFGALLQAWNATHFSSALSSVMTTYTVDNAPWHFVESFAYAFGVCCMGAAVLAFFGYALKLLVAIANKE